MEEKDRGFFEVERGYKPRGGKPCQGYKPSCFGGGSAFGPFRP